MNIGCSQAEGLVQNLVNETRNRGLESGVGFFVLDVENNFLIEFCATAFLAQFLDGLSAQPEMLFDDGVNGAGRRQYYFEAFAQQQPEIALLHLAGRFAESENQTIILEPQRQ